MQGHAAAQVLARLQRAASCGSDEGSGHHARDGFLLARASQSSSASPSSARSMQLRGSADEARAAALQGDLLATRLQQDTWRHAVQLMPLEPAGRHQLQPTPPPPPPTHDAACCDCQELCLAEQASTVQLGTCDTAAP